MIAFKRAVPADAVELASVQKRTFDDDSRQYLGTATGGPPGYDSVKWQTGMMKKALYYKILADGQLIGGMIIFRMPHQQYVLGRIFIDPAYQNQGIGTRAMTFIEQTFPDAQKWTLGTPSWATRNHHFYEKMGYVRTGIQHDNSGADEGFLYEKVMPARHETIKSAE